MTESKENTTAHEMPSKAALPRSIHLGLPIASILVLLAFAVTISLPANKAALPVQSTVFFIPMYVSIVIIMVFGSIYLFKKFVEQGVPLAEE